MLIASENRKHWLNKICLIVGCLFIAGLVFSVWTIFDFYRIPSIQPWCWTQQEWSMFEFWVIPPLLGWGCSLLLSYLIIRKHYFFLVIAFLWQVSELRHLSLTDLFSHQQGLHFSMSTLIPNYISNVSVLLICVLSLVGTVLWGVERYITQN